MYRLFTEHFNLFLTVLIRGKTYKTVYMYNLIVYLYFERSIA